MGLNWQGVKHKGKLTKAQQKTSKRVQRTLSASETLSPAFVHRQLDLARNSLMEATALFPVGPEANEMLALLDLQNNDWPAAFRAFDAVASAGLPVAFYAQVNSSRDSKIVRSTKIEIEKDAVRLVYLSSYNAKKGISEAPQRPAGEDDLGNLAVSAEAGPDLDAEALSVPVTDLEGVQTDKGFVIVKLPHEQLMLSPVYMVAYTPTEGRAAREFGNEYTRMFARYLGYEKARLGKEGMTFGERLKLGVSFVDTGMNVADAILSGGIASYGAVQSARSLARQMGTDLRKLQRTLADERRALSGLTFMVIPVKQAELAFREHSR